MPLSDEEQKILKEIEAQLNATDPGLVEQVSRTTLYRHAARNIRWAAPGFRRRPRAGRCSPSRTHVLVALIGFLVMLGCLLVIERNVRKLGKAGLQSLTGGVARGRIPAVRHASWRSGSPLARPLPPRRLQLTEPRSWAYTARR